MLNSQFSKEFISNKVDINNEDITDLLETAGTLIDTLVHNNPMLYNEPNFHENIQADTISLLKEQLIIFLDDDLENEIIVAVDTALQLFYHNVVPKRSYIDTFIRIKPNYQKITDKLDIIRSIPQPDQRTDEWYEFRYNHITASSAWKAFLSENKQNELIYEKCCPLNLDKYKGAPIDSPLHWGQKYEPISVQWYDMMNCCKVEEFGCIPHQEVKCLAASPDGIVTDKESDIYGRMLEIKNVVSRVINGVPKLEYWIQMQLQMEVCKLNECDFLETKFVEYEDEVEFNNDGSFIQTQDNKLKGGMMCFMKNNKPFYEYPPISISKEDFETWENKVMERNKEYTWVKNIYWRLEEISCVLVLRNKLWFKAAKPVLENIWSKIEYERKNGYEHRAPKKNNSKTLVNKTHDNLPSTGCLLDDSIFSEQESLENKKDNEKQHKKENKKGNKKEISVSSANNIINIATESLEDTSISP